MTPEPITHYLLFVSSGIQPRWAMHDCVGIFPHREAAERAYDPDRLQGFALIAAHSLTNWAYVARTVAHFDGEAVRYRWERIDPPSQLQDRPLEVCMFSPESIA